MPRTTRGSVPGQRIAGAALEPLADESLASWLNTVARHSGMETASLLRELQLNRDGAVSMAQTRLPEWAVRRLLRRTASVRRGCMR